MNPHAATTEEHAAGTAIAVLPEPTIEARLREQVTALESQVGQYKATHERLGAELMSAREAGAELKEKLDALQENPLTFAIANMDGGQVLLDAGEQLTSLCADVQRRQEKGKLSIAITVKPFKGEAMVFVPELKVTPPKAEPAKSVFYALEDGKLSRNDPSQKEFSFRNRADRDEARN